jgi:hypothetical protein
MPHSDPALVRRPSSRWIDERAGTDPFMRGGCRRLHMMEDAWSQGDGSRCIVVGLHKTGAEAVPPSPNRAQRRYSSARSARRRSPLPPKQAERTKLAPFAGIGAGNPEPLLGCQAKEDVTGVGQPQKKTKGFVLARSIRYLPRRFQKVCRGSKSPWWRFAPVPALFPSGEDISQASEHHWPR